MRPAMLYLPLLTLLAGCGGLVLVDTSLNPDRDRTLTGYVAYGDSITHGVGVANPATQGYPALIAHANVLPLTNRARSGDQACDVPTAQIFPYAESPSTASRKLYTVLISTNDADNRGAGPYEPVFNLCHQASIAWLALPLQYKLFGSSAGVKSFGATHVESANNWNAVTSDAQNSGVSFPLQLAASGAVYIWYRFYDGSLGTFTCSLDGQVVASLTSAAGQTILTANGTNNSLALLRLPAVAAGSHTLTLTQTSAGTSGMGIVAVGIPPSGAVSGMPRVLVGTTPRELIGGNAPCSNNDASCQAYIADIMTNVALIRGDGLNVTLFDSRKYMTGTSVDMSDSLHPNTVGNAEIFQSIEDILD